MIDKFVAIADAFEGVADGSTILIGGFGASGEPTQLIDALVEQGAKDLTMVANGAGAGGDFGISRLIEHKRVRKVICSFPGRKALVFAEQHKAGEVELEIVPQGTIAERIRAGGAGIPAFYTATSAGTLLGEGKPTEVFDGVTYVLERAIKADLALIEAWNGDRWGNLTYRSTGRNFNPIMAMAAELTVVQVQHKVELGDLDPETIITPGVFVNRMVHIPHGNPPKF
ncbi:MAG: 3-oxoacid CoA-transferase subunit A [Alphaproteobacteria bacterium]|nr:3-oxoacid CoA-transferase subunit A [Alphaproteobacteria bacterium]